MRFSLRTLLTTVTSAAMLAALVLAWSNYHKPSRVYQRTFDAKAFDFVARVGASRQQIEDQLGPPNLAPTDRHTRLFRHNLRTLPSGSLRPSDTLVAYKRIDIPKRVDLETANSVGVLVYRDDVLLHSHYTYGYPADLLIDGPLRVRQRPEHQEFDEAEMDLAIQRARAELEEFVADLNLGSSTNYNVKTLVRDGGKTEAAWVTNVAFEDGRFTGTIQNEPTAVSVFEAGDPWNVEKEDVIDWSYMRHGKMYGNYTVRPLLATMPKAEAKQIRSMMAAP